MPRTAAHTACPRTCLAAVVATWVAASTAAPPAGLYGISATSNALVYIDVNGSTTARGARSRPTSSRVRA